MLSFDPAVQDCGKVLLSLSVSEPKSAADTFLLDMVVRHSLLAHPDTLPQQNPRICASGSMQTRFFRGQERDFDLPWLQKILNPSWLNRSGKIIGGWVEVDRWLQNFCSETNTRHNPYLYPC